MDAAVDRPEVVLAEQRQVGLREPEIGRAVDAQDRARIGELSLDLAIGEARVDRVRDGAELHQRVHEDHVLEPGGQHQRDGRVAAHATGRQPPRGRGRLALELGVGERRPVGDQGAAVGAGQGALGEPVVEQHLSATKVT